MPLRARLATSYYPTSLSKYYCVWPHFQILEPVWHPSSSTLSVKRNLSLLQSVTHWNPKHQHVSYLGTDYINLSLISTSKKTKVYFNQRGDKLCNEIARGQFSKITETACLSGWKFEADKSRYGVYVTRHWNWMNSYWMFWIGCLRGARSELAWWAVSAILKNDIAWFNLISLLFDTRKSCVFQIFLLRSIKAYMCQKMIHFNAVDFSERRPEEVISFFWRSVYLCISSGCIMCVCFLLFINILLQVYPLKVYSCSNDIGRHLYMHPHVSKEFSKCTLLFCPFFPN